jgi:hypothetical protein
MISLSFILKSGPQIYFDRHKESASKVRYAWVLSINGSPLREYIILTEAIDHPKNSFIFINTNQVHYFCTNADNEESLFILMIFINSIKNLSFTAIVVVVTSFSSEWPESPYGIARNDACGAA